MKDGLWEKSHVRDEPQNWECGWESLCQKILGYEISELFDTSFKTSGQNTVLKQKIEKIQSKK